MLDKVFLVPCNNSCRRPYLVFTLSCKALNSASRLSFTLWADRLLEQRRLCLRASASDRSAADASNTVTVEGEAGGGPDQPLEVAPGSTSDSPFIVFVACTVRPNYSG